jgi:hypothetical protein
VVIHVKSRVLSFFHMLFRRHIQLLAGFPLHPLSTPRLVDMTEAMKFWLAAPCSPQEVLTANGLSPVRCVQNTHWRAVGHHHIDSRKVGNWIFGDGHGVRGTLVRRVIAVLVTPIRECPVAKLWLVWGCVDLGNLAMIWCSGSSFHPTRSLAPFLSVKVWVPSSRYVTPADTALSPNHISLALVGRSSL